MISIKPTDTEFVTIEHQEWELGWRIWLPECIFAGTRAIKPVSRIQPNWIQHAENHWSYTYELNTENKFDEGEIDDFSWKAEIQSENDDVHLNLELTNASNELLSLVVCDGGCLQAMNEEFADESDHLRSYILKDNEAVCLDRVHRCKSIRSIYHSETCPSGVCGFPPNREDPGFFGYSDFHTQSPVIIGSTSQDQNKAIAIGYEQSHAATQNGDNHHCLHSRPFFGDMDVNQSVSRKGIICFGDNIQQLLQRAFAVVC